MFRRAVTYLVVVAVVYHTTAGCCAHHAHASSGSACQHAGCHEAGELELGNHFSQGHQHGGQPCAGHQHAADLDRSKATSPSLNSAEVPQTIPESNGPGVPCCEGDCKFSVASDPVKLPATDGLGTALGFVASQMAGGLTSVAGAERFRLGGIDTGQSLRGLRRHLAFRVLTL